MSTNVTGASEALISDHGSQWTPARIFMLFVAVWHVPLAVAGFIYDRTFPIGSTEAGSAGSEHIFGIFETNGWHTLLALILGVVATYYTIYPRGVRQVAMTIGVVHVGVFLALVFWEPKTLWLASNGADQVLHAISAIGGIGSSLATRRSRRFQASSSNVTLSPS